MLYNSVLVYNLIIILFFTHIDVEYSFVYDKYSIPIEFVTLKGGSEGLVIRKYLNSVKKYLYEFLYPLYPFLPSEAIDITKIINNHENIFITKSNRKLSIIENNVHVTDGLNEDIFQQMLNKTTYHSNIYTFPIFKTIQNMLEDISDNNGKCDFLKDSKIDELTKGNLFHFKLEKRDDDSVDVKGLKKSQDNEWEETQNSFNVKPADSIVIR